MKITWLSAADGPAADVTARVLPHVALGHEVERLDSRNPPWAELNRADVTVFVIGADETSGHVRRLSRRHPGVVIAVGDVALEAGDALGVLADSETAAERLASPACPVAVAPAWSTEEPEPWLDAFDELVAAAVRFRPLLAAHRLGQAVSDELSLWNGFPSRDELCAGVAEHLLHRRIVEPLASAVDEVLERDGGGGSDGDGDGDGED